MPKNNNIIIPSKVDSLEQIAEFMTSEVYATGTDIDNELLQDLESIIKTLRLLDSAFSLPFHIGFEATETIDRYKLLKKLLNDGTELEEGRQ